MGIPRVIITEIAAQGKQPERLGPFRGDGCVPNSRHPVLLYRSISSLRAPVQGSFRKCLGSMVKENDWYLDWVETDAIYRRTHFHSNSHEALLVVQGVAMVEFGGRRNGDTQLVNAGDMVIIPAGVGHRRMKSSNGFTVCGLYPNGCKWNMRWGKRKEYQSAVRQAALVPIPEKHPLLGALGKPFNPFWEDN